MDFVHRTKGTVNHLTRELKQVILDAAENVGNEMTIADPRGAHRNVLLECPIREIRGGFGCRSRPQAGRHKSLEEWSRNLLVK